MLQPTIEKFPGWVKELKLRPFSPAWAEFDNIIELQNMENDVKNTAEGFSAANEL